MSYGLYTFNPEVLAAECDAEIDSQLRSRGRVDELGRLESNRPNLLATFISHSHDRELLGFLARVGNRRTRFAVAINPRTSPTTLAELAGRDSDDDTRAAATATLRNLRQIA